MADQIMLVRVKRHRPVGKCHWNRHDIRHYAGGIACVATPAVVVRRGLTVICSGDRAVSNVPGRSIVPHYRRAVVVLDGHSRRLVRVDPGVRSRSVENERDYDQPDAQAIHIKYI